MTEKEEWVERLKQATLDNQVGGFKRKFMRETDRDKSLWEEIEIEVEERLKSKEGIDEKTYIDGANKILNYALNSKGKMLQLKHLRDLEVDDIAPNYDKLERENKDIGELEDEFKGVIVGIKLFDAPNANIIEDVMHKLSEQLSTNVDTGKQDSIVKKLEDFLKDLSEADITLARDRDKIYDFWRKVHKEYKALDSAIDDFKEEFSGNPDISEMLNKLKTPPNYIVQIPPQEIKLEKVERRLANVLESLGGKPSTKARVRRNVSRHSPKGPTYSSDKPEEIINVNDPSRSQVGIKDITMLESNILGQESMEFIEEMGEESLKVDPILAYVIKNELLDVPIGLHELDIFQEHIGKYIERLGDTPTAKKLEEKLVELEEEASSFDGNAFLPYTDWVAELEEHSYGKQMRLEGGVTNQNKIQQETSEFFELLGDILLEDKGQHTVSQESFTGKGDPLSDSDKPTSIEGERSQPYEEAVERLDEEKIKELIVALNRYYFAPLDSEYFVEDEKPEFIHEVQGRFSYNVLRFNFGRSSSVYAEKKAVEGIAEHANITNISRLIQFFKDAKQGTMQETWVKYISSVEKIVRVLDKLMPEGKKNNRIWAARSIHNTLSRHTDDINLDDIKLFGKPIEPILNKEDNYYEPISNLKTFLQSPALLATIVRKEKYAPGEAKNLQELSSELLDLLTMINKHNPIGFALLTAHDSIRKMQGKGIVYGKLCLDSINDMDYVITKIAKENKVEVNSMEIDSIVKSLNSFTNLSQKHGVSEEIIYKIKGLCR